MSYTAYTAFIITIHHLSAVTAVIIALCITAMLFLLFFKHQKQRYCFIVLVFLLSLIVGAELANKIYLQKTFDIELVQIN